MSRADRPPRGLWLSYDSKVSPRQGWQGPWRNRPGRHLPVIGNSFGLPAGVTCPGRTGFCAGCYGAKLEKGNPGVAPALAHNLELLAGCGGDVAALAGLLDDLLGRYEHEARHLAGAERIFRVHWDGDFYSEPYARAWAQAMAAHPTVRFWCYTRSFRSPVDVLPVLVPVANLRLYLSVDDENRAWAAAQLARWPGVRAAYCAVDYRTARDLAGERRARGLSKPVACPENARRIPIATEGQGACVSCGICPDGRRDIMFATSKREDAGVPVRLVIPAGVAPSGRDGQVSFTCKLGSCRAVFQRPAVTRGRPPEYCSRACQVKGYTEAKKARAVV